MPDPEPYGKLPDWDKKSTKHVGDVVSAENPRDVLEVARALAAHGGGTASFDLALDLVLNEVVEEARMLTGATGAAIGLARDGEMVCRASSGADAPGLGVRFEMASGLSGACLQTGRIQTCDDTETDLRVNAEACRQLGVRSMMVLPLADGKEPFGILEVFSSRPGAFRSRDVNTLQVLAGRVVESKREAAEVPAAAPSTYEKLSAAANELSAPSDLEATENSVEERASRRAEVWTSVLGALVIVVAVLLGLAIGWRGAMTLRGTQKRTLRPAAAQPDQRAQPVVDEKSSPPTKTSVPSVEPQSGGLVVTQNGKVIYKLPAGTSSVAGDVSDSRLIHRVEPQYPAEARARHIQGAVALDVQVGGDGAVHNITVVEGDPVLAEAAVQAVRQWRYRPYSVDGRAVEMQTRVTIRFRLPG